MFLKQITSRLLQKQNQFLILNKSFSISKGAMGKLDNKVAIVTASSEGIGLAIVKKLAQDGCKVMLSSRKGQNVDKALNEIYGEGLGKDQVKGMICHVGQKDDRLNLIDKTLKEFGGIDILVSNAATNPVMGNALDCPEKAWDKIFEINVKAALLLTQEVHPHMLKRKGGSIVYISSIAGIQPFSVLGAYSVSKTALLGLTKVIASEVASDNIRVNCVCPGIIQTKFSRALIENPDIVDKMLEDIPLRKLGTPENIGGVVSFLCSDDAAYMTGENVVVAGGQQSRL